MEYGTCINIWDLEKKLEFALNLFFWNLSSFWCSHSYIQSSIYGMKYMWSKLNEANAVLESHTQYGITSYSNWWQPNTQNRAGILVIEFSSDSFHEECMYEWQFNIRKFSNMPKHFTFPPDNIRISEQIYPASALTMYNVQVFMKRSQTSP